MQRNVNTTASVNNISPVETKENAKDSSKRKYDLDAKFPQGITLTWTVDAYVKKKVGTLEKIKKCCRRNPPEVTAPQIFVDPRLGPYQIPQIQEPENPNIKQILKQGY